MHNVKIVGITEDRILTIEIDLKVRTRFTRNGAKWLVASTEGGQHIHDYDARTDTPEKLTLNVMAPIMADEINIP